MTNQYTQLHGVLAAAVVALAFVIRLFGLTEHSFSGDEIVTIDFAALNLWQIVNEIRIWENHPPLYYWIMHFVVELFGVSEYSLRLPSVLFGVAAVYYVYRLGCQLFSPTAALVAAAFLALSPFAVTYSQDGRMYSLLLLMSVISSVRFICWLEHRSLRNLAFYWIPSVLLIYTHVYGILFVFGQSLFLACYVWSYSKEDRWPLLRSWVICQITVVVASLPWLLILALRALDHQSDGFWIGVPTLRTLITVLFDYCGSREAVALWVTLIGVAVVSAFVVRDQRQAAGFTHFWAVAFCIATIVVVHLIPFAISQVSTPVYLHKYTLPALPAFFLLGVVGASLLPGRLYHAVAFAVLAFGFVPGYVGNDGKFANVPKLAETGRFLQQTAQPHQGIVLCGRKALLMTFPFYIKREQLQNPVIFAWTKRVRRTDEESLLRPPAPAEEPIADQVKALNELWFVSLDQRGGEGCEDPQEWVGSEFESVENINRLHRMKIVKLARQP